MSESIIIGIVAIVAIGGLVTMGTMVYYAMTGRIAENQAKTTEMRAHDETRAQRDDFKRKLDASAQEVALKDHALNIYREAAAKKSLSLANEMEKVDVTDAQAVLDAARRRRGQLRTEVSSADRADVSAMPDASAAGDAASAGPAGLPDHPSSSSR